MAKRIIIYIMLSYCTVLIFHRARIFKIRLGGFFSNYIYILTTGLFKSPSTFQRSATVRSPTNKTTNRPTNFTDIVHARDVPVNSCHSNKRMLDGDLPSSVSERT